MAQRFCAWLLLLAAGSAYAEPYAPDIREFSRTDVLDFAGHSAFNLGRQSTLELWVAAGWQQDPGYDPVVIYNEGDNQLLYALSVLGDRSGLALQSGEQVDELPFAFSDGQLHHVVLVSLADGVVLMVDGQVIGQFELKLPDQPSTALHLGSAANAQAAFTGALGGLRIWRIAVQRESLVAYALADAFDAIHPHPDLEDLAAYSDLHNDTLELLLQKEDTR